VQGDENGWGHAPVAPCWRCARCGFASMVETWPGDGDTRRCPHCGESYTKGPEPGDEVRWRDLGSSGRLSAADSPGHAPREAYHPETGELVEENAGLLPDGRRCPVAECQALHSDALVAVTQPYVRPEGLPMAAKTYTVYNSAMATTAAPVSQPTGSAIRTMMQLCPATGFIIRPISWGISFDASAAATPGKVELIEVNVAATMSTAFAAADIQPAGDANAPANTAGSSGVPLNLSTGTSGFATTSVTEGSTTASRMADIQLIAPTNQYMQQWPLGREFECIPQRFLRVRVTFGATVNMICWVTFEI
jgi:hypothetical protein